VFPQARDQPQHAWFLHDIRTTTRCGWSFRHSRRPFSPSAWLYGHVAPAAIGFDEKAGLHRGKFNHGYNTDKNGFNWLRFGFQMGLNWLYLALFFSAKTIISHQ